MGTLEFSDVEIYVLNKMLHGCLENGIAKKGRCADGIFHSYSKKV